ncbi:glycosyltransferase [Plectonema cf. radiosum LEGE 06105]|uniref:Glycosyltransferase n=1 Tax=Plectonema cf. radiosum LEGE 06105 TaxID=945769 RepID=A0A8J7F472_9CYAN|nr:glycosyltransferase [Plectonema radiosum]MBE9213110.1 glycosyltransferase [Plectonema cf. radiosum LEGE 06105]
MKIAFFISKFPSLSETFILNQITGLIDRGHEVDIYAERPTDTSKMHPEVTMYHLLDRTYYIERPENRFWRILTIFIFLFTKFITNPIILLKSLNFLKYGSVASNLTLFYAAGYLLGKERKYDIIHCHFGPNGLKAAFLRDIGVIQGKLSTTFHGYDITIFLKKYGDKAYDFLFQFDDIFLPISERWKRRLIEIGCNCEIIVHHMGIDCKKFTFALRKPKANGRVEIVTIARLVEKKGIEYGIRAVAKLVKDKPHLKYSIIGDGPLREQLQKLIEEFGINENVRLLGWKQQEEIIEILTNADIFMAPSITTPDGDQEGIPVVLMETMAMGLPVVSTQHSGIPELVKDGVSGFLVPERDVDALAQKLSYLIEHPELWTEIGKLGHAFVEEYYNINKLNDQLVKIYQNLLHPDTDSKTALTALVKTC